MPAALDRAVGRSLGTPVRAFTVLATVFGVVWVLANPAWLGFDERTHFARAWGLSGGHVVAQEGLIAPDGSEVAGDQVPVELTEDRNTYVRAVQATGIDNLYAGYADLLRSRPGADDQYEDTRSALAAPFTGYVPSAVPLVLVRAFDLPLLLGLWLARLANLAVYVLLVRHALARARSLGWLIAAAALVPLNLYVASSVTPDGVIVAGMALAVALSTRLAGADAPGLSRADVVLACVVFASVKPPYSAAVLALPAVALAADPSRWRRLLRSGPSLAVGVTVVAATAWRLLAARSYEPVAVFFEGDPFESDPGRQIDIAFDEPLRFVGSVLHSTFLDLPLYARRWMFGFGPFELASSAVGVAVTLVFFAAAIAAARPDRSELPLDGRSRIGLSMVAMIVWLGLIVANFAYFIAGLPRSLEIPGRYSAPILILVVAAGAGRWCTSLVARSRLPSGVPQLVMAAVLLGTTVRAVGVWAV